MAGPAETARVAGIERRRNWCNNGCANKSPNASIVKWCGFLILGIGAIAAFGRRVTYGILFWAFVFIAIGATLIIVVLTVHDG
jgi:hypothetical protein